MNEYSLELLKRHWDSASKEFDSAYADCYAVFDGIVRCSTPVIEAIAQRKALEPNCAYLLLAKSLNHAFATLVLMQRGLVVDAALTCRNGVETLLLLELLSKQPALCGRWAAGEEFRPSDVRRQLQQQTSATVGDLIIEVSSDTYDDTKFVYSWLSRITHANLESLSHTSTETGQNGFVIHIGGKLSRLWNIAITKTLGTTFSRALLTCAASHAPSLLESHKSEFMAFQNQVNLLGNDHVDDSKI